MNKELLKKLNWSGALGGGIVLPVFADPIGGPLQHLWSATSKAEVAADGFTYITDIANKGSNRPILEGVSEDFDGINGIVTIGNVGNTQYIQTWIVQGTDDQVLFTLQNSTTTAITVVAGVLTFGASLTVNNIYVDGVSKTPSEAGVILNDNAVHLLYIEYDQIATSNLILATDSSSFGDISLFDVRVGDAIEPVADLLDLVENPALLHETETGMWHLDEGSGTTRYDSSGNENHGTASGGVSFGTQDVVSFQNTYGYTPTKLFTASADEDSTISPSEGWLQAEGDYFELGLNKNVAIASGASMRTHSANSGFVFSSTSNTQIIKSVGSNLVVVSSDIKDNINTAITIRLTRLATGVRILITQPDGSTHQADETTFALTTVVFNVIGAATGVRLSGHLRYINNNGTMYNDANNWSGITFGVGVEDVNLPTVDFIIDALNNPLSYSGKTPKNGRLVNSHCGIFDGVADTVNYGDCGSTTSVSLNIKFDTDNQYILSLDNTTNKEVFVSAGVLTFGASLTESNILVDGVSKTAAQAGVILNDNAFHLLSFDLVSVTSSDVRLGSSVANFGNIQAANFVLDELSSPIAEGEALVSYDVSGNGNDGIITATASAFWANTQDLFHYNILNGFELYDDDATHLIEIKVPYVNGVPITPTIAGFSKISDNTSGKYHNGAETEWQPNPLDGPELIYRSGLDSTIERHNSATFVVPEFMNNLDLIRSINYVVYTDNLTAGQITAIEEALGI